MKKVEEENQSIEKTFVCVCVWGGGVLEKVIASLHFLFISAEQKWQYGARHNYTDLCDCGELICSIKKKKNQTGVLTFMH